MSYELIKTPATKDLSRGLPGTIPSSTQRAIHGGGAEKPCANLDITSLCCPARVDLEFDVRDGNLLENSFFCPGVG